MPRTGLVTGEQLKGAVEGRPPLSKTRPGTSLLRLSARHQGETHLARREDSREALSGRPALQRCHDKTKAADSLRCPETSVPLLRISKL